MLCSYSFLISQERLVLNNNTYLLIENGAQLVLDNNSFNAITLLGSGGNIITEAESNKIKWNIEEGQSPYFILDTQEIKTTWHPIENISGAGGSY